jgi:hypothetical protein
MKGPRGLACEQTESRCQEGFFGRDSGLGSGERSSPLGKGQLLVSGPRNREPRAFGNYAGGNSGHRANQIS